MIAFINLPRFVLFTLSFIYQPMTMIKHSFILFLTISIILFIKQNYEIVVSLLNCSLFDWKIYLQKLKTIQLTFEIDNYFDHQSTMTIPLIFENCSHIYRSDHGNFYENCPNLTDYGDPCDLLSNVHHATWGSWFVQWLCNDW